MFSLIACMDLNRAIGYENQLLVKIPQDLKRFKELTTHHKIVMGCNTALSLPGPLPDRENIVLTNHHKNDLPVGFDTSWDILDFINRYEYSNEEVFIIGGQSMYEYFISFALRIYLTKVYTKFENADTFFPPLNPHERWFIDEKGEKQHDDKTDLDFRFFKFTSRREQIYGIQNHYT